MKDILLITNVAAGTHDEEVMQVAAQQLRQHTDVEIVETCDRGELDVALGELGDRVVVIAGGDGSLHLAVASLCAQGKLADATIGLIPLGTGNDFARGMRLPLDPVAAAEIVTGGQPRRTDILIDDSGNVVVNAVHVGVGADAARAAGRWKSTLGKVRLGKVGYRVGAVVAGFTTSGYHIKVEADGKVLTDGDRPVLQVGIGNSSRVGGGAPLAPDATPDDGVVDVVVSYAVSPRQRFRYGLQLRRGTHGQRADVDTTTARKVTVSGKPPFYCNADGELIGPLSERTWTVEPGAFTMLLPRPDQEGHD
ncbi:MAG: diacylglycerol/lipid kinase family protein [Nocardioidaceae bacterium]